MVGHLPTGMILQVGGCRFLAIIFRGAPGKMTEHLGQMAACQQQLMHGLQEYLGLDVSGVDVAVTRQV